MQLSGKRICILTTGHLATSPRMTKAADALAETGAAVHVISTRSTPWAVQADEDIVRRRRGKWTWEVVDYRPDARATYMISGMRYLMARQIARLAGPYRPPLRVAGYARERVFPEVVRKALDLRVDLVYGGGAGLMAAAYAGRKLGVPFGVDLEDFHSADQADTPDGRLVNALSGRIEHAVLPEAAFRTAGSEEIGQAYTDLYGLDFVTVNNTFAPHASHRRIGANGRLTLYWFSQTIGPGRGLEDVILAAGMSGVNAELHLQGRAIDSYVESLVTLARECAQGLRVIVHPPCLPDEVVSECAAYDVGLALETDEVLNRRLCLTNKALAYVAAGMAVVLTDTPGQRRLAGDLGPGGFLYASGDVARLAQQITKWSHDRVALGAARDATRAAALRRWHWDHPRERGALVDIVERALSSKGPVAR